MQDSIAPFTASGIFAASSPIRSCMIVAVQATGRTVMSIGPLVSSPPTSLWWSMIARMSAALIRGQFGGVVGVDDDDGLPGLDAVDDGGLVQTPARQHEGGLGVRFAEEDRRRLFACDFAQVPGPDDRGAGAVGVGGFVAENEGGISAPLALTKVMSAKPRETRRTGPRNRTLRSVREMAFTPLHDRVLVRRVESDDKTKGGLIIPDSAKEKPAEGEVSPWAQAPRTTMATASPWTSRPATSILFGKWSGTEITLDGEELLIMKESDILGVIA
jgi:chaperonin GroES